MDFQRFHQEVCPPVDFFRLLHHPGKKFRGLDQVAYRFKSGDPIDYVLLTREQVGGLWNNVPDNLLTLSPGQWMEFGFYPLQQWADEIGIRFDVNDLIIKHRLVAYYQAIPERFGEADRIRTFQNVERIEPDPKGFRVTARHVETGEVTHLTSTYVVYAAGQRCILRRLDAPGADLPFVTHNYTKPEDFPGQRVLVVGGGRSADWAATELFDAGRDVIYVQRQPEAKHVSLIRDSQHLPYYFRIAQIMHDNSDRWQIRYETKIEAIDDDGQVTLRQGDRTFNLNVDHVILEIGGIADYSVLQGFPQISLVDKYDDYRFQVQQMRVHPHNYESMDVPNLYAGGYLAQDIGLVVFAMHGTTYAIAGDILQKEGIIERQEA